MVIRRVFAITLTDLGFEFDRFSSLGELIVGIHETINYYNRERIHTSLKMSPQNYWLEFFKRLGLKAEE